tara:strand:- start:395 stop:718 length:324 start_codon:yes stop_codon:yes gene_type:complete
MPFIPRSAKTAAGRLAIDLSPGVYKVLCAQALDNALTPEDLAVQCIEYALGDMHEVETIPPPPPTITGVHRTQKPGDSAALSEEQLRRRESINPQAVQTVDGMPQEK